MGWEENYESCFGDKQVEMFPLRPSLITTSAVEGPTHSLQVRCMVLMRLSSLGQIPALRHCQLYADHGQMTD